jgi:hypothetical protein
MEPCPLVQAKEENLNLGGVGGALASKDREGRGAEGRNGEQEEGQGNSCVHWRLYTCTPQPSVGLGARLRAPDSCSLWWGVCEAQGRTPSYSDSHSPGERGWQSQAAFQGHWNQDSEPGSHPGRKPGRNQLTAQSNGQAHTGHRDLGNKCVGSEPKAKFMPREEVMDPGIPSRDHCTELTWQPSNRACSQQRGTEKGQSHPVVPCWKDEHCHQGRALGHGLSAESHDIESHW